MDKSHYVMLMYLIMHLGLIFFMYPENIIASTDAVHWIAIVSGLAVQFIFIAIYMKGLNFFPGKDIIAIYGSAGLGVSLVFLVPIVLYFLMINIITVRAYSEIISIVFLANTPLWAIMILLMLVSTYIAAKGVETIFRTGLLLGLLFLPMILLIFLASFQNVDWNYVFPLYENDFTFWTRPTFYQSFFAFAGSFLFLGFVRTHFPYKDNKVYLTVLSLVPFFIFSVYVPVLTFGQNTASTLHFPYVVVIDTLQINWLIFDRITMFFLFTLITFIMLFTSLILWMTSRIVSCCKPSIKQMYYTQGLAVVIYILCLLVPDWKKVETLFTWNAPLRFYCLIAIPLSVYYLGLRSRRKMRHEHA